MDEKPGSGLGPIWLEAQKSRLVLALQKGALALTNEEEQSQRLPYPLKLSQNLRKLVPGLSLRLRKATIGGLKCSEASNR